MRLKYKSLLSLISFMLVITLIVGVCYLFYDKVIVNDDFLVFVDDELSINYLNGNVINNNSIYDFSVTNNSNQEVYYEINLITNIENINNINYTLLSEEANLNLENRELSEDLALALNIKIGSQETHNFKLQLNNIESGNYEIEVKKIDTLTKYFSDVILENNEVKEVSSKVGEEVALSDEGLIKDVDDYGTTYYFRGNVENNYVSFAGELWRIVRINGDNSVRIILNGALSEVKSFNESVLDDFGQTNLYQALQEYYNLNLASYDSYIGNAKFCNEIEKSSSEKENIYNSYNRLAINKIPTFNCLGTKYNSKIGLITADEVVFAGHNTSSDNQSSYLYNADITDSWWTATLAKSDENDFYPFLVTKDGKIVNDVAGNTFKNVRPVINIERKTIVSGEGTLTNPYVVE